jgi:hypothetical protein
MAMKVQKPAYSDVIDLDIRLYVFTSHFSFFKLTHHSGEFEHNLPFSLRCRAALMSMPSRYPQIETAIEASPEPSRRSMIISFQVCPVFALSAWTVKLTELANESRP